MSKWDELWDFLPPPKKVRILNRKVRVEPMSEVDYATYKAMGLAKRDDNLISLKTSLPLDQAQDTLLHEILHFIWRDMFPETGDKVREEEGISLLSVVLLNVFQMNPKLMAWLVEE